MNEHEISNSPIDRVTFIEESTNNNMANRHESKIQDEKMWKSLRSHILSQRETNKQAEISKKKKCFELKKIEENKLSLEQINGRLSELQYKRYELEEKKRSLLNQIISLEPVALKWYLVYQL